MKKIKLTLDKLNVVRLNASYNIVGGKHDPTGATAIQDTNAAHSTYCPPDEDSDEDLKAITLKSRLPRGTA